MSLSKDRSALDYVHLWIIVVVAKDTGFKCAILNYWFFKADPAESMKLSEAFAPMRYEPSPEVILV